MPGRRIERLNEQFRRELTEVLHGVARDPRVAQVTITGVRAAPDLSFARVFVAPAADEAASGEILAGLRAALPFLRRELGARMRIRRVPELRFELDRAVAHGRRIEELLHEVAAAAPRRGSVPDAPDVPEAPGSAAAPAAPAEPDSTAGEGGENDGR